MKKKLVFYVLIVIVMFACINVKAQQEELYSVNFANDILKSNGNGINVGNSEWNRCADSACKNEIIQRYFTVNNDRISFFWYSMDNENSTYKSYISWSNKYCDDVKDTDDKRCLVDNEYLTIIIDKDKNGNDLSIETSKYNDIRLNIDYMALSSTNLVNSYSLEVFLIDSNNNEYGPYYLGDYEFTGYYRRSLKKDYFGRGFKLVTENLKTSNNIVIKKIKIIPFGNSSKKYTFAGDWGVNEGSSFIISQIDIQGYKDSYYENPNVQVETLNENENRINTVKRMYDLATIKWYPSNNMNSIFAINGTKLGAATYLKDEAYYGPPYSQVNRVTVEKFYSALDSNKKLPFITDKNENGEDVQSGNTLGNDCSMSVSSSVSKYIPLTDSNGSSNSVWNRNKTTLLGNLKVDNKAKTTESTYRDSYNKYLEKINANNVNVSEKNNFKNELNTRIKSNDSRTYYLSILGDDGNFYNNLGYSIKNSTSSQNAVPEGEPFTLKVDNLNIESGKTVDVYLNYLIDENTTYDIKATDIDKNKVKIKLCSSENSCINASEIVLSTPTTIKRYNNGKEVTMSKISTTVSITDNISSVQIIPFDNEMLNKVFRLYDIEIKVNGERYLYNSASKMATYFTLVKNMITSGSDSALIYEDLTSAINGTITDSTLNNIYAKFLASQDIYKGYMELIIGDIVSRHRPNESQPLETRGADTHIRIITGSTHIECLDGTTLKIDTNSGIGKLIGNCDAHMGINSGRSYYIRSDIASSHPDSSQQNKNNYGGLINENDYVISWVANPNYTDIKKFSDLENKNLDYYINKKEDFNTSIKEGYLPIRYNVYITGKIEKPYVQYINGNTEDNIKEGFKGSIYSNYQIISINFDVKNLDTGKSYSNTIYPEYKYDLTGNFNDVGYPKYNSSQVKESTFVNSYSLYYNTPEEIQNKLKEMIKDTDNYVVKVTVNAGTDDNLLVLHLGKIENDIINPKTGNISLTLTTLVILIMSIAIISVLYKKKKIFNV